MKITKFLRVFIETDVAIGGNEGKKVLKKEEEIYVETSVKRSGNNIFGLTIIEVKVGEINESIQKLKADIDGVKKLLKELSTKKVRYELSYLVSGLENEEINTTKFSFDGMKVCGAKPKTELVKTAFMYLNAPYLWGGKSPFGIDCSGFTQMVYKINGYHLLRDASQQATQGEPLSFIEESEEK